MKRKHRAKKLALALALTIVSAVTVGGYVSARALDDAPQQEKQQTFEEHLAQKEAEFERNFNAVKQQNDEFRRKFDSLPQSSESEIRDALARSLKKHEQE